MMYTCKTHLNIQKWMFLMCGHTGNQHAITHVGHVSTSKEITLV